MPLRTIIIGAAVPEDDRQEGRLRQLIDEIVDIFWTHHRMRRVRGVAGSESPTATSPFGQTSRQGRNQRSRIVAISIVSPHHAPHQSVLEFGTHPGSTVAPGSGISRSFGNDRDRTLIERFSHPPWAQSGTAGGAAGKETSARTRRSPRSGTRTGNAARTAAPRPQQRRRRQPTHRCGTARVESANPSSGIRQSIVSSSSKRRRPMSSMSFWIRCVSSPRVTA